MRFFLTAALLLFFLIAEGQQRLFQSDSLLSFTLKADFTELLNNRYDEELTVSGTIMIDDRELPVKVSARGNFRRDESNCEFPPLWIKNKTNSTNMDRVKKIKLVTHCNNDPDWQNYVLKEYLVYRMYRRFTDLCYKVRLCRISYRDGEKEMFTRFAFLIEENKKLADRIEAKRVKDLDVPGDIPDFTNTSLISFFQYMIGNTDWYMPDHNIRVYARKSLDTVYIPYDFDLCGFVNKPGSNPRAGLKINSVRERYYLGHCRTEKEVREIRESFNLEKDSILGIINKFQYLDDKNRQDCLNYINGFYAILNDPKRSGNELMSSCDGYF